MSKKSLTSIIIPTMNRAGTISNAIASCLIQSTLDIEVVVIDDASTDETPSILDAITDDRLQHIRFPVNRGVAAARNAGIAVASGDWAILLDSDDLLDPNAVKHHLEARSMEPAHPDNVVTMGQVNIMESGDVSRTSPIHPIAANEAILDFMLVRHMQVPLNAIMVPLHLARAARFPEGMPVFEDWQFFVSLERLGARFLGFPHIVGTYVRSGGDHLSSKAEYLDPEARLRFLEENPDRFSDAAAFEFLLNQVLSFYVTQNRWRPALGLVGKMLRHPGFDLGSFVGSLTRRTVARLSRARKDPGTAQR